MRTWIAAIVVALQVLVLGFMAGQREWIVRFGRPMLLRTAPIDPNDPMRGFYARLNYDISNVPRSLWQGGLPARAAINTYDYRAWRDLRVFAVLQEDEAGVAQLVALTDVKPTSGLFLQGRVDQFSNNTSVRVRYGVEAMFMEQGKSQKLEDMQRDARRGAPIDAEIAVNAAGVAVLKGYHWEPLGLTATLERASAPVPNQPAAAPGRPPQQRQVLVAAKLEFKNYGSSDIAIVDSTDGGSFRLVPAMMGGTESRYRWANEGRALAKPNPASVIVLKPGQTHVTRIDLTRPEWFVVETKPSPGRSAANPTPIALRDVVDVWAANFRLEYSPPSKAAAAGLPHAEIIQHGHLLSRAFNGGTGMD